VTGWVVVTSYNTVTKFEAGRAKFNESKQLADTLEQANSLAGARLNDVFAMKDLSDLKNECFTTSEHICRTLSELETSLQSFVSNKNAEHLKQLQTRGQELRQWLQKETNRIDVAKQRDLGNWLSQQPTASTNSIASVAFDISDLLIGIYKRYVQFLTNADFVGRNTGLPLSRDRVQKRLRQAEDDAAQTQDLAKQLRSKGQAIELFLNTQTGQITTGNRARVEVSEAVGLGQKRWLDRLEAQFQRVLLATCVTVLALCVLLTVTVYRRMESPEHAKKERQQILTHFGAFASQLAHEIRNPLTAINARLHALQKSLTPGSAEYKDATLIRSEISRLDQIVRDFLLLARPAEPRLASITSELVLQEVKELLLPQCQKRGIDLRLESVVPIQFRADAQQLKQVLINLIQNAADSIEQKGAIFLRARTGEVWIKNNLKEAVMIEVEDTGAGIPAEFKEKIFDPFFSTKTNGTGLGLPISARIIDKHNGFLEFESKAGEGTIFRIVLPAVS
jgi:signal transduction histidine kinase